jgi:5-methylcytosine-specific restriction protein B
MALFFGKIGKAEQLDKEYYAAGPQGGSWYGGITPGDYVFPICKGSVDRLWRVKEYANIPNPYDSSNPGAVIFHVVKELQDKVPFVSFLRYKYFSLNLDLLNKSAKSVKGRGFFEIATTTDAPSPEAMVFTPSELRNLYIALDEYKELKLDKYDIVVVIEGRESLKISGIKIFNGKELVDYDVLKDLYEEKNRIDERYSLRELLVFAKEDKAPKKLAYLTQVIEALGEQGFFKVEHPVALYDNVLVGRKRSSSPQTEEGGEDIVEAESDFDNYAALLDHNPNLILYGPPGTGKTYSTEKIIEAFERRRNGGIHVPINKVKSERRVEFVSFHQSYSYEEFVEGIRPVMSDPSSTVDSDAGEGVKYKIQRGILLEISEAAAKGALSVEAKESAGIGDSARIWKISLGKRNTDEAIYGQCKKESYIAIGWLEETDLAGKSYDEILELLQKKRGQEEPNPTNDASSINCLVNEITIGDIVFIYDGPETIRDIGLVKSQYYYRPNDKNPFPHRRSVTWLRSFDKPMNIMKFNDGKRLTMKTVYPLGRISFSDIRSLIVESAQTQDTKHTAKVLPPYYLIIDEINRGNIAKVFGELISLVEADKRERISCKLLYSRKNFSLPSNLYFIGTMNTADKSIAVLDTALRRRFTFVELEPNPDILSLPDETPVLEDRIDLRKLLINLNRVISEKIDREHRIGHSYFMGLFSLRDFHYRWYYQIIPLLMDYFYGEADKVREIIGPDFFEDKDRIRIYPLPANQTEFVAALEKLCKES